MTCTSIRSTRSSNHARSGVSPTRSRRRSRNWSLFRNSRRQPSWVNSWKLDSRSRFEPTAVPGRTASFGVFRTRSHRHLRKWSRFRNLRRQRNWESFRKRSSRSRCDLQGRFVTKILPGLMARKKMPAVCDASRPCTSQNLRLWTGESFAQSSINLRGCLMLGMTDEHLSDPGPRKTKGVANATPFLSPQIASTSSNGGFLYVRYGDWVITDARTTCSLSQRESAFACGGSI